MQKLIKEYEQTLANLQASHKELEDQIGKNKSSDNILHKHIITINTEIWELYAALNEMREYVE